VKKGGLDRKAHAQNLWVNDSDFLVGGISHGRGENIPIMKKLFLAIKSNVEHSFIIDTQHTISYHSSLSSIPTHSPPTHPSLFIELRYALFTTSSI